MTADFGRYSADPNSLNSPIVQIEGLRPSDRKIFGTQPQPGQTQATAGMENADFGQLGQLPVQRNNPDLKNQLAHNTQPVPPRGKNGR